MGNNYLVPVIVVAILIIASAFFTHKYHETQYNLTLANAKAVHDTVLVPAKPVQLPPVKHSVQGKTVNQDDPKMLLDMIDSLIALNHGSDSLWSATVNSMAEPFSASYDTEPTHNITITAYPGTKLITYDLQFKPIPIDSIREVNTKEYIQIPIPWYESPLFDIPVAFVLGGFAVHAVAK